MNPYCVFIAGKDLVLRSSIIIRYLHLLDLMSGQGLNWLRNNMLQTQVLPESMHSTSFQHN